MSASNQYIVKIATRRPFDKNNTYALMHLDSLQEAMRNLKGESLKLWLYCNKNQDGFQFELSQKVLADWGLKKDAYQSAKKKMQELGYLVPVSEGSNILVFYENPRMAGESEFQTILSEKPTISILSENQIQSEKPTILSEKPIVAESGESEKPTIGIAEMSEKPTTLSEIQTSQSEKAQRNNTIVHDSTIEDSTYPSILRGVAEQIFVNPEYLEGGYVRNGDKIFKIVEQE